MIIADSVGLRYPDGTEALRNINLEIRNGELVYVIGRSGSGKTSLLKLLMGMEFPTDGSLNVLGQPMEKGQNNGIRKLRMKIGPVFQEFRLIDGRSAFDNVILGMRFLGIPVKQIREYASEALERVGLGHKLSSKVEHLSWGERQRVAIARAVARKPSLILADEPTGNLDKDNAMNILEILNSFRNNETSVVITTHATHLIDPSAGASLITMDEGNLKCERSNTAIK
ncbi:MAG TPA: ATP-binding cassette domain-containing protein [Clostridia bacterium]|nr:ATP-binding cassette domain-containing protein [Clostridia bacterium]